MTWACIAAKEMGVFIEHGAVGKSSRLEVLGLHYVLIYSWMP